MNNKNEQECARDPVISTPLNDYPDLLTVSDITKILKVSDRTVYRLTEKDELPAVKIGRRIYFPRRQILERFKLHEAC